MLFDRETEARMFREARQHIGALVWKYIRKGKADINAKHYQDLFQEAAIAYINYIRKAQTEEDLKIFPSMDILHAMCLYTLSIQPLSHPKRTEDFKKHLTDKNVPLYEADANAENARTVIDDALDEIVFRDFVAKQTDMNTKIVGLRMEDYAIKEVAGTIGINESNVSRRLKRMLENYRKEIAA